MPATALPEVSIVCSDPRHPIWPRLKQWADQCSGVAHISLVTRLVDLPGEGDILFLVSCHEIVRAEVRQRFRHTLVLHASDLPEGRGLSPMVWQVLEGREQIVVTLLEAVDKVDAGDIWSKTSFTVAPHETLAEINDKLFSAELELMEFAIQSFDSVKPIQQDHEKATYYPWRHPEDSKLSVDRTIAEQFDLLRMSDPVRYPAYFEHHGFRYKLVLEKLGPVEGGNEDDI